MQELSRLWRCPACSGSLSFTDDQWRCQRCGVTYPVVFDIPDFRCTSMDSKPARQQEAERVEQLLAHYEHNSYEELVDLHTHMASDRPGMLGQLDKRMRLSVLQRGREKISQIENRLSAYDASHMLKGDILEIGCGAGDMLQGLSKHGAMVVAVDAAMDLLILAKKLLDTQALKNVALVCAGAEALPLPSGSVDLVYASHVIEHLPDQKGSVDEFWRVLRVGKGLYFDSPNRFSVSYEPHVQLLGVGYLPRFLMDPYVRLLRGIPYTDKRLLSFFELRRLLKLRSWHADIQSQEATYRPESRSLSSRIYRNVWPFVPLWLRRYVFAESFTVFARKT